MSIFVNNRLIEGFKFSGGEVHVKVPVPEITDFTEIRAFLNSSDDVMSLLMTVDAIRRINWFTQIALTIPYFPYARQDRVCNEGEPLSVKVMADLINSLNCESVEIYDPHSEVTPALIDRCKSVSLAHLVTRSPLSAFILERNLVLISPDAGAEKKIKELGNLLSSNEKKVPLLCARKVRDTLTGAILATEIYGDVQGRDLIILDDICDGGRTFVELAKALRNQGAGDLYLYVTHGIFSKGLTELKEYFKRVYCYYPLRGSHSNTDPFLITLT